ncbi:MAG TPA: molybdopterin-dependent oxidoreductase [Thermoguttaceae bacterium]|nr:molybdopterin-dependent oxidoreductase [Thermoguttaceae bacterium]
MIDPNDVASDHVEVTRRYFLRLGAAGAAALTTSSLWAAEGEAKAAIEQAVAELEYLTPLNKFRFAGRGNPPPWQLSEDKRREVGLTPETWQLEVVADPESNCKIGKPLSKEAGTAFGWNDLMRLAQRHAVRYLKVMTCLNVPSPNGMGLWEGVPLREVIWMTQPAGDIRRLYYYGYDNDDPKQRFQSSLSINRVLEDPPGVDPVILCYKLNGKPLSPKAGGPVRLISPEGYGFHNIKWLQRIVLTNDPEPNDNYAKQGLDVDSPMKTFARFVHVPTKAKAGQPTPVTGLAQVGISGLSRVQYWLHPQDTPLPPDDPHFTKAEWKDAEILPPPENWGSELPGGKLPPDTRHVDPKTGKPDSWPLPYTVAHWAVLLTDLKPGRYDLRCRTIDARGTAQPMPRPFPKSGQVPIHQAPLVVEP